MATFGNNKNDTNDPMENGKKIIADQKKKWTTGFMGGLTKATMGKGFVDKFNNTMDEAQAKLDQAQATIDAQRSGAAWIAQAGMDATAEVMGIQDTGTLINMNPVVVLQLKVQPAMGAEFMTTAQTMVSKIAIPRVGDKIKIKYNPANPTQIAVL